MNVFQKIGTALKDVFVAPVKAAEKIATIFEQVEEDTPELKAALVGLIGKLEAVGIDVGKDFAADGLNVPGDLQAVTDSIAAVQYFKASVQPAIDKVFGQIKTDLNSPVPIAASAGAGSAPVAAQSEKSGLAAD